MLRNTAVVLLLCGLCRLDLAGAQSAPLQSTPSSVSVHDDQITASLDRVPLRAVLDELARRVPLRIFLNEDAHEHLVSARFNALPMNEALPQLLIGLSYAIVLPATISSGTESAGTKQMIEVLVIGKAPEVAPARGGETSANISRGESVDEALLETPPDWTAAFQHENREVRVEALLRWAEQGAATPLNPLTRALLDPDESVRAWPQELIGRTLSLNAGMAER
jgi:hypothetical protein